MNELTNTYKQQLLALANNCNNYISQIKNSNMSIRLKNAYISNAIQNYNKSASALKTKYESDVTCLQQQQQQQQLVVTVPVAIKKRRSLLVGCNYYRTPYELSGCISDVQSLNERYKDIYEVEIITDLTNKKPTRSVILSEFALLLDSAVSGDTILFAFSGHGSYTADLNRDETDGKDELIVTSDLQGIIDDEFKTIISQKLKAGVTLLALFDSCHSGSVLDLKYSYPDYSTAVALNTADTVGNVIMISGCMDNQTSAEANIAGGKVSGAMTWALLESLKQSPPTWKVLLTNMRNKLNGSGFDQIPQLSSGRPLDTSSPVLF